jgi:cyclase
MLKHRIIPTLLLKDGRMIKTKQFDSFRDVGDPITAARVYDAQRADELLFLDISASTEGRGTLIDIVKAASDECFMPLGVGGGIRSVDDMRQLLLCGADKVIINTAAIEDPILIENSARHFGSSTIVVSIDFRRSTDGSYQVYTRRGTNPTGLDPVAWATEAARRGAGEIMITSIDHDGMMDGLDLELIKKVARAVTVPVIASGGVGVLIDFQKGFEAGASAVAAGSIFHFTDQSPIMTRNYLYNNGVAVRP